MTERQIILRADEVRAILDGRKTQTRRPVDMRYVQYLGGAPETSDPADWGYWVDDEYGRWAVLARGERERMHNGHVSIPCPLGQPGDRLWVRETWGLHAHLDYTDWNRDSIAGLGEDDVRGSWVVAYQADAESPYDHWRPSIHMPRWASRITLEITDVGVERADGEWAWVVTFRRLGAEEVEP